MKDVFKFRDSIIREYVDTEYKKERYWPPPLIQVNPNYKKSKTIQDLVEKRY
jgi:hypothetical protein